MTRGFCVNNVKRKHFMFYICLSLLLAAGTLREVTAQHQQYQQPQQQSEEEDAGSTRSPGTGLGPSSGKKTNYQSAYHHVRPGHSGFKYATSDNPEESISWFKVLLIVALVVCSVVFIVVVCAYWSRTVAADEAMSERQAAVTSYLKSQHQQR